MKKVLHSLPAKLLLAMVVGILLGFVLPESVMEVIVTAKYIMGQVITFCVPLIIIGFGAMTWVLTQFGDRFATLVDMVYPYVTRLIQTSLSGWSSGADF